MTEHIWLPDHESVSVEWYISEESKRATGVERINENWIPKRVGKKARAGFRSSWDPEHDLPWDPGYE